MTMSQLVPADATGSYPALVGYSPMDLGRRIAVFLVDGALFLACYFLLAVPLALLPRSMGSTVAMIGYLVILAVNLWAVIARSSRLAGVFMHAQYVDVLTGQPSGGKLLGKVLLTGVISAITFGIAPVIIYFATIQEPLKRNWFDRTLGLMLVDTRTGRRPGEPLPTAPASAAPPAIAPVTFPQAAVPAAPAWMQPAPASTPPASVAPASAHPLAAPTPAPTPAVKPITEAGGLITSTPRSSAAPAAPEAPAVSFAPPIIRDMRSVDAAEADHTQIAGDWALTLAGASGPQVLLDDGSAIPLNPPTVIGRNPQAPGSHPDASPRTVDDPLTSKTHLLMGSDEQGPWVIDLHSRNGVLVSKVPGVDPIRIEAGRKVHLPSGSTVAFGGRTIAVR